MSEPCVECGGRAVPERGPRNVQVGDRTVTVDADFLRCEACGEVFYAPGQMREMQRAAVDRVRQEDGLLSPTEIEALRARYGLSQASFERLLNVGSNTVAKWERGTAAPHGTADTLLRILRERPEVMAQLARQKGIPLRTDARRTA